MFDEKSAPPPPYSPGTGYAGAPQQGYSQQGYPQQSPVIQQHYPQTMAQGQYGYAPPPQNYPMQSVYASVQQGTTQVIIMQPGGLVHNRLGAYSQHVFCSSCQQTVMTRQEFVTGGLTWIVAGGLCLFGCSLGCCLIPFCVNDLKDVNHSCSNCGNNLGTYRRL